MLCTKILHTKNTKHKTKTFGNFLEQSLSFTLKAPGRFISGSSLPRCSSHRNFPGRMTAHTQKKNRVSYYSHRRIQWSHRPSRAPHTRRSNEAMIAADPRAELRLSVLSRPLAGRCWDSGVTAWTRPLTWRGAHWTPSTGVGQSRHVEKRCHVSWSGDFRV